MKVKELRAKLEELANEGKDDLDVRMEQDCACCWFNFGGIEEFVDEKKEKFIALR